MNEQTYSIKDLEDISGIKTHTIRAWERRYSIFTPARTDTNIRLYSDDDLKKLLNISVLQKYGMKISRLAELSDEDLKDKMASLISSSDFDSIIDSLVIDMINFNQASFEKKLNRVILNIGFEEAIYAVVYPFFQKVGILWLTSTINPAQEHFVSSIIIQKFFIAIDSLDIPSPGAKKYLLFLPAGEFHEVGLLFGYYLIRKAGHKVIYLGQSIPKTDVIKTWKASGANFLYTHLTSLKDRGQIRTYLKELSAGINGTPIWVSGFQASVAEEENIDKVFYLASPDQMKNRLNEL